MRQLRVTSAALFLAVLAALLTAAISPASAAPRRTLIEITVVRCDTCTVSAYNFLTGDSFGTRRVRDSTVRFRVQRELTNGLGFFVEDASAGIEQSPRPLAVVRYFGTGPGRKITSGLASGSPRARHCWAGTTEPRVRFRLVVDRFVLPTSDPAAPVVRLRPFLARSTRAVGKVWGAPYGTIGAAGDIDCSGRTIDVRAVARSGS